jgi:hypothetical protein
MSATKETHGVVSSFMGLGALNLLPFNPLDSGRKMTVGSLNSKWHGSLGFGLAGGGAVSVCSLACNPGIFMILGTAMLQGFTLWMGWMLAAYALGFSLPLGALMLGASFATAAVKFKSVESVVRGMAGILRIAVGFYFLWTF